MTRSTFLVVRSPVRSSDLGVGGRLEVGGSTTDGRIEVVIRGTVGCRRGTVGSVGRCVCAVAYFAIRRSDTPGQWQLGAIGTDHEATSSPSTSTTKSKPGTPTGSPARN
jgi:hypothetical protein